MPTIPAMYTIHQDWEIEGKRGWWIPFYPAVPELKYPVTRRASPSIPPSPGVYFVYEGNDLVYVGQSKNLRQRVTAKHKQIRYGSMVSWLEMPDSELSFAESFYIGALRPSLNFGGKR